MGRKPLAKEKVKEVEGLLRGGHSCREISGKTGVSLGKVGEIRKNMKILVDESFPSETVNQLQNSLSTLEKRLSRVERMLVGSDAFVKEVRSALEFTYQVHVKHCIHLGKLKPGKCPVDDPSKIQCALCPYYVPKWLPGLVLEKMESFNKTSAWR